MATADLRNELECSICLNTYTDPVMLQCGHNFCRLCIDCALNTQDGSELYSCPQRRTQFYKRPSLQRNITLSNIVEHFLSIPTGQNDTEIFCTNCINFFVPAVKSCLHCEVSLCHNHLRVHSKSAEHILTEPSTSMENRKCSIHKKIIEYYCTEDAACICVSCRLDGDHQGHRVKMLDEASEKKKKKLRNVLQKLIIKREETEDRVQSLDEQRRKAQEKAAGEAERVTALFTDIRRWLNDLEKRVLSEISRQEKEVARSSSALIKQLEIKKDELCRKIRHIEELCNMTDPLTILQGPDTGDLCDPEERGGDEDTGGHDKQPHDVCLAQINLHVELSNLLSNLKTELTGQPDQINYLNNDQNLRSYMEGLPGLVRKYGDKHSKVSTVGGNVMSAGSREIHGRVSADILLDINTAGDNMHIANDLKTASWTETEQDRPEIAERFQDYNQVMSSRRFCSGQYYWDVESQGVAEGMVGMCYPSIDRRGDQSLIGYNNKSWCLQKENNYRVIHDSKEIQIPGDISSDRVRICLDYEAGLLSFYELCDPIRHLHTFTATFTEPLHAILCVGKGSIKILEGISYWAKSSRNNPKDLNFSCA